MSSSLSARKALVCWALAIAAPALVWAQSSYLPQASQYAIAGALPGDQVHPQLSLSTSGGFLVWEDNLTDGYGLGISALRLDSSFSGVLSPFRVNVTGTGDQSRPQVSLLQQGGAAFVWQGGPQGYQHIYARFLSASNLWATGEVQVNTATTAYQVDPVLGALTNGNVVVVYSSFNQVATNSLQDVYGQVVAPNGQKVGSEFRVNQFSSYNQRNPAVAVLADGRFVVAWVSEQQRSQTDVGTNNSPIYGAASVDIYARLFTAAGVGIGNEFLVNSSSSLCSAPRVAAAADGTFMIVWTEQDRTRGPSGMDVMARVFSTSGVGGVVRTVNTTRYGDQYFPTISAEADGYFAAWTSLAQDGSQEGVFGQFFHTDGSADGAEVKVNTTWMGRQIHSVVASDGHGRFLAAWASYVGGVNSFDLFAQRYVNVATPLPPMAPPFVYVPFVVSNNLYLPQLQVSWPVQAGFSVDHYEVYADGAVTPTISLTTNIWQMTAADGLTAGSTHTFQVAFVTSSGRRSPLSGVASARTWSGNNNWGGIPSDWMTQYYGSDMFSWARPTDVVSSGGPTLLQVFLSGGNPLEPSTWLRTRLLSTPQGYFLTWNPQPGLIYQVQTSADLKTWSNQGAPRFAADAVDSLYVGGSNRGYYRVLRLR